MKPYAAGEWDANLADFPRLAGETDDAPRFLRAVAAAPNGVLRVPKGEYDVASPIRITNRCSLSMHPAAHLVAHAKMDYVVFWDGAADYHALSVYNPDGSIYGNPNLFIRGGDIDGNGLASCLAIANSHHFTLADTTLHNGKAFGLRVTRETGGHLYELVANNVYCKTTMSGLAGNVGIECQMSDCHFTDCFVIDYTKGIRARGSNRFTRCHVWSSMGSDSIVYSHKNADARHFQHGVHGGMNCNFSLSRFYFHTVTPKYGKLCMLFFGSMYLTRGRRRK